MTRRLLSVAALAALAAVAAPPAAAREPGKAARLAETMRDPDTQRAMAAALRALSEAMLDVRIGPLARAAEAIDPRMRRRIDPDATVRDLAGPDAERIGYEMSERVPAMMGAVGESAVAIEAMTPVLKDIAREMGAALGAAVANARRGADAASGPPADYDDIPSAQEE